MDNNFQTVFDAYPDAEEIFVVGEMPFISREAAAGHAAHTKASIEEVKRPKPAAAAAKAGKETSAKAEQ